MAPRKRTTLRPKSLSSVNGSSLRKSSSQSRDKGKNTISSSDLTVYMRLSLLILLVLAVGGFLLYPDILNIIKVFHGDSANDAYISEKTQESLEDEPFVQTKRRSKQDGDFQVNSNEDDTQLEFDDIDDEDLMEDEESIRTSEHLKSSETQNMKAKENRATETKYQNGNSLSEKETKNERADTTNGKSSRTNANNKQEKQKSQKQQTGHKTAPIVLNAKNKHVVLDPSQIKFVDSPSSNTVDTKHDKDKESKGSSKAQNTEQKKHIPRAETKVQKTNNSGDNVDVLEEAKNFNSTFQKTFTPKKIFADGRRIPPIELLHQKSSNSSVRVFLFDDFLSQQECDGLIKAHDSHVKALDKPPILCFDSVTTLKKHIKDAKKKINVTPKDFTKGTKCVNDSFSLQLQTWMKSNWSYSTAFYPGESSFSKIVAYRIKEAMGLDPASGGKFQITSYPEGKAYKEHTDCSLGGQDLRDRVVSVLMYLSNVDEGGETTFPELGIWVKPKKGRAIVWNNMSPDGVCEEHSKHIASVVKNGSKYILIRWYYYKTFYSLGKRPQPPHLPEREPGQPVVQCDEYSSGSCRWYDEWSYQHLMDYEQNKLTLI